MGAEALLLPITGHLISSIRRPSSRPHLFQTEGTFLSSSLFLSLFILPLDLLFLLPLSPSSPELWPLIEYGGFMQEVNS